VRLDASAKALPEGIYVREVEVAAPGARSSPQVLPVRMRVIPARAINFDMRYPDRDRLMADGWDFAARLDSGDRRDSEYRFDTVLVFNPWDALRVPADVGSLDGAQNNSRNSLFRDLPPDWSSLRVDLDFSPLQDYQEAGLALYENDDNYVQIRRVFNEGHFIELVREAAGERVTLQSVPVAATTGMVLRLDRGPAGRILALYSVDGSATWKVLGHAMQEFAGPRLALITGALAPGNAHQVGNDPGFPSATYGNVQVVTGPCCKRP
jgi:hypothetical protein